MVYRVPLWRRREIRGLSMRDLRTTLPIFRIELDVFTPFFCVLVYNTDGMDLFGLALRSRWVRLETL
jgi:hypothetical protein